MTSQITSCDISCFFCSFFSYCFYSFFFFILASNTSLVLDMVYTWATEICNRLSEDGQVVYLSRMCRMWMMNDLQLQLICCTSTYTSHIFWRMYLGRLKNRNVYDYEHQNIMLVLVNFQNKVYSITIWLIYQILCLR